ncbi:sigma-70 family RNA polymerase sigma factor [Tundrisphaera lichenicola]|uniref:sigma-70 family RNA polymerase sigma factor n=1 Tax=Tundrisphaera lichenicola TaxID=2029860 RepID=UPI003EBCCF49
MASTGIGSAYRHLRDLFGGGSTIGLADGQLLARYASSKDGAAFEALVGRHGPMVLATCRAILKNEQDAEDAFQATFLVLARKAGSVRGGEALGGWLHRVARRSAVQASVRSKRRRRKEAEASAMTPPGSATSRPVDDLKPILHEEIDRLPESQRLPVILCDLQGLTYDQAAQQLEWTEPTLRCRLARGRQKLRDRLTRRGITAPAVALLLAGSSSSASVVPSLLVRSVVSAATGGTASAGVLALTQTILRGMLMTKIKFASTALLAAIGLTTAGVIATGAGRPDHPEPSPKRVARAVVLKVTQKVAQVDKEGEPKPGPSSPIRGRVVGPDGKPVAGAVVRLAYLPPEMEVRPEAISGPDGRFAILLPDTTGKPDLAQTFQYPNILAAAPGFGPGWIRGGLHPVPPDDLVMKLVEEGPPIEGRIIDLEGRPVADAQIKVEGLLSEINGDFSGWIARARADEIGDLQEGQEHHSIKPLSIKASSGPDGRFLLRGIGKDRVAELLISGPGIVTTRSYVMTRDEPKIQLSGPNQIWQERRLVHPPRFELALPPSRKVEGIARDRETGRPIAGLIIRAGRFDDPIRGWVQGGESRTDAEGRYRLDGLPRSEVYRLFVQRSPGLPYTNGSFKVTAGSPDLEPIPFDFVLKRGIVVRGKVTDKVTGEPVRAVVSFFSIAGNPNLGEYPGFSDNYLWDHQANGSTSADGEYEVIAIPGLGQLAVWSRENRFRSTIRATVVSVDDKGEKKAIQQPSGPDPSDGANLVKETNFDPEMAETRVDLELDPGRSVTVEVVDPEGRPLDGSRVKRDTGRMGTTTSEPSRFEVQALAPSEPCRVTIYHEDRKLIAFVILNGDEPSPMKIQLQPWGTITGRIVDDQGQPRPNLFITNDLRPDKMGMMPKPSKDRGEFLGDHFSLTGIPTGDDARFRIERLIPGFKYYAMVLEGQGKRKPPQSFSNLGHLLDGVTVAPGEVKDLGDLKPQPFMPQAE